MKFLYITSIIIIICVIICLLYNNNHHNESDEIYKHLKYITTIMEKHNIKYWITYGTLLGAVRENNIIKYDYDFDIGANIEDIDNILALNEYIKKDGYSIDKAYMLHNNKSIWKVSLHVNYKGKQMGDIYLYKKFNDGYMRRYDIQDGIYFWPKSTFPYEFVSKLIKIRIRDKLYMAPQHPIILIEQWYTKKWHIPIKAESQGGNRNNELDYYGGAINQTLTNYKYIHKEKPIIDLPIKIIYPEEDKEWVNKNETIINI